MSQHELFTGPQGAVSALVFCTIKRMNGERIPLPGGTDPKDLPSVAQVVWERLTKKQSKLFNGEAEAIELIAISIEQMDNGHVVKVDRSYKGRGYALMTSYNAPKKLPKLNFEDDASSRRSRRGEPVARRGKGEYINRRQPALIGAR